MLAEVFVGGRFSAYSQNENPPSLRRRCGHSCCRLRIKSDSTTCPACSRASCTRCSAGGWKSRVKGRDFYDFVWYVGRNIEPNLARLEARMHQSGHWTGGAITRQVLVDLLLERFAVIDFEQAAEEFRVFLPEPRDLQLWLREFFDGLATRLGEG